MVEPLFKKKLKDKSKTNQETDKPLFKVHRDSIDSDRLTDHDTIPDKDLVAYMENLSIGSDERDNSSEKHESEDISQKARFSETLEQHLLKDMSQFLVTNNEQENKEQETDETDRRSKQFQSSKTEKTRNKIDFRTAFSSKKKTPEVTEEPTQLIRKDITKNSTDQKKLTMSLLLSQAKKEFDEDSQTLGTDIVQISLAKSRQSETAKTSEEMKHLNKYYGDLKDILDTPSYSMDSKDQLSKVMKKIRPEPGIHETKFSEQIGISSVDASKIVSEKKSPTLQVELPEKEWGYKDMKMVLEIGHSPTHCERFLSVEEYSKLFVEGLTGEALRNNSVAEAEMEKRKKIGELDDRAEYTKEREKSLSIESLSTYVCVLEWPTIDQFTVETGVLKINEYLSFWKFEEDWKHCVNFLYDESDDACTFYRYEVIFSIPCKEYPIPQVTASVYFTFEVSRIRPRNCLVDVYYNFEGQRLIHTPGKFKSQEQWLFNIVDAKIKFFKTLTF